MATFTFSWKARAADWTGGRPLYKSASSARRAADKWATMMADQDCPVTTKVYELVSDGRGGLVEGCAA